jgi:hypothetical protein
MSASFLDNTGTINSFVDKVQYNFRTNVGPTSIAGVPSVLTNWERVNGYYLAPDDFGIDRKFRNGIMVPEDANKVSVLTRAFEKAVHDAFTDLLDSSSNVSSKSVNNSNIDVKSDRSYGPTLSDAIKQGLVLDSSGRIVTGNSGNNGSDLVYRGNEQAQFTHWEGARGQKLANPNGQWTLVFTSEGNYGNVILYDENKNVIFSCPATSGRIGEGDRSKEHKGPIPFGSFILDPKEISGGPDKVGKFIGRNILGDWGFYRAPLKPQEGANMGTRGEFFLHGGFRLGSAGCIDIGTYDLQLFPLLMQHEGLIRVDVIKGKLNDILFPNGRQNFDA